MDAVPHSLLEQIVEQQPAAEVSAETSAAPSGCTLSLKDVVDALNRVARNEGSKDPLIISYEDRNLATIEFHSDLWLRMKQRVPRVQIAALETEVAGLFERTGKAECSVKVNGREIARLHHSRVEGRYVWESVEQQWTAPKQEKNAMAIILIVFVGGAILAILTAALR